MIEQKKIDLKENRKFVSKEIAIEEIESWLDSKRIPPSVRDDNSEAIDYLVEAIQRGKLSFDKSTGVLTQVLEFPVNTDDSEVVEKISYKQRINDLMLKPYLVGVKSSDARAFQIAYLSCITGKNKTIISMLDTIDKKISNYIVLFFI